jgi:AraC family transcriptional regulator of adaptative response/methylated-DNA-[protein]-cysteine methyltransferase
LCPAGKKPQETGCERLVAAATLCHQTNPFMSTDAINYQRIQQAIDYLAEHVQQQPDLDAVAAQVHLSPFHFQRLFTEWAGVSPKKFLQYLTLDFLKQKINAGANVAALAEEAGLSSPSRVHDLFVGIEGVTPAAFRQAGKGLLIRYGYHNTPFGMCFAGATERGICGLSFVEEDRVRDEFASFSQKWAFAELIHDPQFTQPYVHRIFAPEKQAFNQLSVLVQGTPFQLQVWEALLRIPLGAVSTYEQIGRAIGKPTAARAVGTAVGDNPVGYLIPCHRVIRKAGQLGEYRWGSGRKKAMIGWEMARAWGS